MYPVSGEAVTPSDSVANAFTCLFIGVAGNVAVKLRDDSSAITFLNVPAGSFLPVQTSFVMSTNTTATNILGLNTI